MSVPGLGAAFGAGLLSFLSPCVLPLLPGYLSFIGGASLAELRAGSLRGRLLARTAAFVLGFSLVFSALSLAFSGASLLAGPASAAISIGAGILVIALGLNIMLDIVKVLNLEARFHPKPGSRGLGGAFALGLAFAAGWSPCVGPLLASILLFAAEGRDPARSAALLAAYSLGLGLPFFGAALFFERLSPLLAWFRRRARGVRIVSGLLLVGLGSLMAFRRLGALSGLAFRAGYALADAAAAAPAAFRAAGVALWALAAGLSLLPLARRQAEPLPVRRRWPRIAVASAFAGAAAAEAAGLWSTAGLLAAWLGFGGA